MIQEFNIGYEPNPSDPCETLIATEGKSYLLFYATQEENPSSQGVAVLECKNCWTTKLSKPLEASDLDNRETSTFIVQGSSWVSEAQEKTNNSRQEGFNNWNTKALEVLKKSELTYDPNVKINKQHYLINLGETIFECLAESIEVIKYTSDFNSAIDFINTKHTEYQ